MAANTFQVEERLKSHTTIARLFKEGNSFGVFPLRVVWLKVSSEAPAYPAQFALTVPKKKFKHAVDRNRLRRRIRESYRLQKADFYAQLPVRAAQEDFQYALMIIYVAKETRPYAEIDQAMKKLLQRLSRQINQSQPPG